MAIKTTLARSMLALTLATAPMIAGIIGSAGIAYAKGGEGHGGDHDGGGHGGDDHGGGSNHDRSSDDQGQDHGNRNYEKPEHEKSTHEKSHTAKASKTAEVEDEDRAPSLRSLNRNYHAYLNSHDPRMTAVVAYAKAYAEFEAENGVDAVPTDPELSDDVLREALAGFTKDGVVSDDMLEDAKSILGVGPEVGKIDQIRETLVVSETTE